MTLPMDYERNAHKTVIVLPFAIGAKVKIKGTDIEAITYSVAIGRDGFEYMVKWWNDAGQRGETWVQPCELELA